jgi:hypothetical protein
MPKALIFGLDLFFGGTQNSVLSHERTVKATFLQYAPEAEADIVMYSRRDILTGAPDVYAILSEGGLTSSAPANNLFEWLRDVHPTRYDLVIFAYTLDIYYRRDLNRICSELQIPVFIASGGEPVTVQSQPTNLFVIGGGLADTNTRTRSGAVTSFTSDDNRTGDNRTVTSWTTAVAGAYYTRFLSANEPVKAFLQAHPNYPNRTTGDGYGRTPVALQSYTPDLFPPVTIYGGWFSLDTPRTRARISVQWVNFAFQTVDTNRIYVNGALVYEGFGEESFGHNLGSRTRLRSIDVFSNGQYTIHVTAVKNGIESLVYAEQTMNVTVTGIVEVAPTPPTPDPIPVPPPDPVLPEDEPIKPVEPDPIVFTTNFSQPICAL